MLWVAFRAFGGAPPVGALTLAFLVGYLGNIAAPGGIGALDGGLTGALILYGAAPASAAAAVLVYHVIVLWLPTLFGTIAFLRLRATIDEPSRSGRAGRSRAADLASGRRRPAAAAATAPAGSRRGTASHLPPYPPHMPRRRRPSSSPARPTGAAPCGSNPARAAGAGRGARGRRSWRCFAPRPSPRPWPTSCSPPRTRTGPPRHRARVRRRLGRRGDREAMWRLVDEQTRKRYPLKRFSATYRASDRAATVAAVRTGAVEPGNRDRVLVLVEVRTRVFRTLRERSRCRW